MGEIKLYIATSIDGYIARKDNSIDWLESLDNPNQIDHGYGAFYETIDTVVMGRKTYEEVLGFGVDWPYPNCQTFVITTNKDFKTTTPHTAVLNSLDETTIGSLKQQSSKDIWLVGGGQIISAFLNLNAIDDMLITLIPIVLGEGLPLFPNSPNEKQFTLDSVEGFETGAVNLVYKRKT